MKEKLLEYLKTYKIDLEKIISSGKPSETICMVNPNDMSENTHQLNCTVSSDEKETDIFFASPLRSDTHIFQRFCEELVKLVNENSELQVQFTAFNHGEWFGWRNKQSEIHFGIINEEFRFEARFSIKN